MTLYQQCRDTSAQELQGIKKELQEIDTTLKSIQPIGLAKDSAKMKGKDSLKTSEK